MRVAREANRPGEQWEGWMGTVMDPGFEETAKYESAEREQPGNLVREVLQ